MPRPTGKSKPGRIKRNSGTFCKRLSKEYKLCKQGKKGLRKNSKTCYESALRTATKKLRAKGLVRCSIILKKGKKIRFFA